MNQVQPGFGVPALTGGALYYLASSTLAVSALYLLVELVERARSVEVAPTDEEAEDDYPRPFALERLELPQGVNLDDDEEALVGKTFPAATVFLGLSFIAWRCWSRGCRRSPVSSRRSRCSRCCSVRRARASRPHRRCRRLTGRSSRR